MPDDEYRTTYSAAQKMQLLKSQQAKLEIRAMPAHSQLKLKVIMYNFYFYRNLITKFHFQFLHY